MRSAMRLRVGVRAGGGEDVIRGWGDGGVGIGDSTLFASRSTSSRLICPFGPVPVTWLMLMLRSWAMR